MKKIIVTLVAVIISTMAMAEPVTEEEAREKAAQFILSMRGRASSARSAQRSDSGNIGAKLTAAEVQRDFYVFNIGSDDGFVIVSGDDCVGDNLVLGYTEKGCYNAKALPANMQWWLNMTASQINELSKRGAKVTAVPVHEDVPTLITTLWGQGENIYNPQNPYNAFCPVMDGKLSLASCMSTALAQVMYYHRWPKEPIAGELPAYEMEKGYVIDALPPTSFDWDNMVDDYTQPTTKEQQDAVALLMRYCGQTAQMYYSLKGSGGYFYDTKMLVTQFGYDSSVFYADADAYTVSGWDELLYNELKDGRPIIYNAESGYSGHSFVLDGYAAQDGCGYYHVNWGWVGDCNGYYKINLMNPDNLLKYTANQFALIGLQPAVNPISNYDRYLVEKKWNIKKDGQSHIFNVSNSFFDPGVFEIALAELNEDGTADCRNLFGLQTFNVEAFGVLKYDEDKCNIIFSLPEGVAEGMTPGAHKMVFVNREADTNAAWRPLFGPNCSIEFIIGDDGLPKDTLFHPMPQFACSEEDIKIDGLQQRGLLLNITAAITNNNADDIVTTSTCAVYLLENNTLKKQSTITSAGIMAEGNSTCDVSYSIAVSETGNFVVVLTKENIVDAVDISGTTLNDIEKCSGYIGHKTFTIDPLEFYCKKLSYNERADEHSNPAYSIDITLDNSTPMDYDAAVLAVLYKRNDDGSYDPFSFHNASFVKTMMQIPSNTSKDASFKLSEQLKEGEYKIELFISNDFHSPYLSFFFGFNTIPLTVPGTTGIGGVESVSGERLAVSGDDAWYDMFGRKLNFKPTKKGTYIHKGEKITIK